MTATVEFDRRCPSATDGEIAAINLQGARRSAWARFAQDARLPGVVEAVVDQERIAAQFFGDLDALDRLEALASQFARVDESPRAALVHAEVAPGATVVCVLTGHGLKDPDAAAALGGEPHVVEPDAVLRAAES